MPLNAKTMGNGLPVHDEDDTQKNSTENDGPKGGLEQLATVCLCVGELKVSRFHAISKDHVEERDRRHQRCVFAHLFRTKPGIEQVGDQRVQQETNKPGKDGAKPVPDRLPSKIF